MALFVRHVSKQRHLADLFRGQLWASLSFSTEAPTEAESLLYKTSETLARNHSLDNVGQYFTVDPKIVDSFGEELTTRRKERRQHYFGPSDWIERNGIFGETNIMIRRPALEIINYIKKSDLSKPAYRYVLYGRDGVGKSLTLSHIACYGHQEDFVVMNLAWIKRWLSRYYDIAPSTYKPGRIDHVVNANVLLKNFKQTNQDRLANCVTHREYVWSARDKVQAGAPLMEVLDLGCDRLTFAADALNVLIRELKLNSTAGNLKLMVLCDGVNALFTEYTMIHKEREHYEPGPYKEFRTYLPKKDWMIKRAKVEECSVLVNLKKLLRNDYSNAVVVVSADRTAKVEKMEPANKWWRAMEKDMKPDTRSHLPFALFGDLGWELLNPFIPVEVENYTPSELDSAIDYSIEKGWIRTEAGTATTRRELHFLTGRNPADFFKFSALF